VNDLSESCDASTSFPHLQPLSKLPAAAMQLLIGTSCLQFGEDPFNQRRVTGREQVVNPTTILPHSQHSGLPTNLEKPRQRAAVRHE